MRSDPIDWETPFKIYEFLKRHEKVIFFKNPEKILIKAIELNPKSKKLYEILIKEYKNRGMEEKAKEIENFIQRIFKINS